MVGNQVQSCADLPFVGRHRDLLGAFHLFQGQFPLATKSRKYRQTFQIILSDALGSHG
jgi:hypothetical protein